MNLCTKLKNISDDFLNDTKKRLIIESKFYLNEQEKQKLNENNIKFDGTINKIDNIDNINNTTKSPKLMLLNTENIKDGYLDNKDITLIITVSSLSFIYDYFKYQRKSCLSLKRLIPIYFTNFAFRMMIINVLYYSVFSDYNEFYTSLYTKYITNKNKM